MEANSTLSVKQRFSAVMSSCSILSALLVVWIHTYNVEVYGSSNRALYWVQEVISQGIARGAVPFFLMSSAYFLYSKDRKVMDVYRSRTKSLIVPYLLWNLVYMVAFTVLRRLSLSNTGMDAITVGNVAQGLFLQKYNYAYWFMRDLIILVAAYPIIRWLMRCGKTISFIALGVLFVAACAKVPYMESAAYYCVGAIIGYHYQEQAERATAMKKGTQLAIAIALLLISGTLFAVRYAYEVLFVSVIRDLVTAFLWLFIIMLFDIRVSASFAGLAFMIYSLHPLLLEIIEKIIYLRCPHNDLWMMIDYILAPVICVALIVGVCFVWKKILPKIYCLFNGGRI